MERVRQAHLSHSLYESEDDAFELDEGLLSGQLKNFKILKNLNGLFKHLPEAQATEFTRLIVKHPGLFGDVPSC